MTGKEALRILIECANGEKKLLFSDSLDLEKVVKKELEELAKYKRAFDILKKHSIEHHYIQDIIDIVVYKKDNAEEYELLEELMKDEGL